MSKVEKVSVALTDDILASVRAAVASGDYASTSEVVRDALRAWRERQAEIKAINDVRTLAAEGDASGYSDYIDMQGIKRSGRDALAAGK